VRLTRVYVEAPLTPGSTVTLPPDTASHLAKVLRARSGDELILFNGDGREFSGAIQAVRGSRVSASVGESRPVHSAKGDRTRSRPDRAGIEPTQRRSSR